MAGEPVQEKKSIAVLTPLVAGPYFGAVVAGIAAEAAASGLRTIVVQTLDPALGDTHAGIPELDAHVAWGQVRGAIVVTAAVTTSYIAALQESGVPIVLLSHEIPELELPSAAPDNRTGTREAVAHLYAHGHRRIAFAGHPHQADLHLRYEAYREAMKEHGLDPSDDLFYDPGELTYEGGVRAARLMLASGLTSTAVVTGNDLNAIGIMSTLQAEGYRIPEDQAVIGFDDISAAESQTPALSTVSQRIETVGARAVRLLLRRMDGEAVRPGRHLVPTALIVRRSCGCSPDFSVSTDALLGRTSPAESEIAPGAWLQERLRAIVVSPAFDKDRTAGLVAACDDVAAALEAATAGTNAEVDLDQAVSAIYHAHPRGETGIAVVAAVQRAARRYSPNAPLSDPGRQRLDDCVRHITLAFGDVRTRDQAFTTGHLQVSLRQEYDISMDLLRGHQHDPAELRWLSHSPVSAGCLALWSDADAGPRRLEIVSTFGPDLDSVLGPVLEEQFPPAELVALIDQWPGTQAFVLPVKTDHRDWGLLALVGLPETRSLTGRETYFQWAAMLSVALDYEAMVDSLREQREDLAEAYTRERELAESFRSSEERYAMAASAANDGLWDWDLEAGSIYFSPRWKSMLGYEAKDVGANPDEWLTRVHDDDVVTLRSAIDQCRSGSTDTLEHEHRIRAHDGSYRWVLCRALAVPGSHQAATRLVGSLTDITERRTLEEQLRHQALFDTLTELPNRALFLDRLGQAIARSSRRDGEQFAVLFIDLDGFKVVNDSLGHMTADLLLREVADRIRAGLRSSDTAARLGGDEFTVLLEDVADLSTVASVARKIQERICLPYELEGNNLVITATIGVTTSAIGYVRAEDALRDADIAMYRAKSTERGTSQVFDPSMHEGAVNRLRIESELRHAIEADQMVLHYQPIVRLETGELTGLEALVRWQHPDRGLLLPGEFLPISEDTGLIVPIGRWVITQACAQLSAWQARGLVPPELTVSINISNREFWNGGLLEHLTQTLAANNLEAERLTIEITEGVLMGDVEKARAKLQALRDLGLRLHVDDFGTGYSSLEALHRFPIDALKIDRSFVTRLDHDRRSRELVRTIIMMGKRLNIDVIAEGVETREQQKRIVGLGCLIGQGFLFARPMPASEVVALLPTPDGVA